MIRLLKLIPLLSFLLWFGCAQVEKEVKSIQEGFVKGVEETKKGRHSGGKQTQTTGQGSRSPRQTAGTGETQRAPTAAAGTSHSQGLAPGPAPGQDNGL